MTPDDVIEVIRPNVPRGRFRAALFDFDGTLSLLREGWPAVMSEMMREELARTGGADCSDVIERIVVGLNGRPTIVQMQALAGIVARRGGGPAKPAEYAAEYQARLLRLIRGRYEDIQSGHVPAAAWAVPGSHTFLEELRARGVHLVVASGTEVTHVRFEADLLGLTRFFDEAVFAPAAGDAEFSKRTVIGRVLQNHGLRGEELLGFGDGVVETEEVRRVGGVAVGVASATPPQRGVDAGKRETLIRAGADIIIADYECRDALLQGLFAGD